MKAERQVAGNLLSHWLRRRFSFGLAALLCGSALAFSALLLPAQTPLNQRVLVVYNTNVPDSGTVANYYLWRRGIPAGNLCAISPPSTVTLSWDQYVSSVKKPVQSCLTALGPANILYIVFAYQTPYRVTGSSGLLTYAVDQYVADIWDQYSTQDSYPYPNQLQPYYEDAQSQGNLYQIFQSFSDYRGQQGALLIYSVWRLDAANLSLAEGLVDKALTAESDGLSGQACLDRDKGKITAVYDSGYGEGDWDLHKAAGFAAQAGFMVTEDPNPAEFGTPATNKCPNTALYSGWYSFNHYNNHDPFTWNPGAIGWHLDSASALDPRGGPNWSANAIMKGITVTSGAMNEPYLEGLVRPGGVFRDLFQGANVGDAFLRNTRWLKWMILNMGDPLYRPFPNGLPPFNPLIPQASLALSSRYVINGDAPIATVTLASAAPPGGTVVPLSSSKTSLVKVPASVTVPGGMTSASFTVTTAATPLVTKDTPVTITASGVASNTITVSPLLGGLSIAPASIMGGTAATGWVILNENAPNGGVNVALSVNTPSASVPDSVNIPAGSSQATFTVSSSSVASPTTATVTATLNGVNVKDSVTLQPALHNFTAPATVIGGATPSATITLYTAAPTGGWEVSLSSSNAAVASVPSTVTVPAGSTTMSVPVTTSGQCSNAPVTLSATSGATLTANMTVTPPPPSAVTFATPVIGGNPVNATVTLAYPACAAGLNVALSSSNPGVANVPSTATVPPGSKSGTFVITTSSVSSSTPVTISATSDNLKKTKVLTVNP